VRPSGVVRSDRTLGHLNFVRDPFQTSLCRSRRPVGDLAADGRPHVAVGWGIKTQVPAASDRVRLFKCGTLVCRVLSFYDLQQAGIDGTFRLLGSCNAWAVACRAVTQIVVIIVPIPLTDSIAVILLRTRSVALVVVHRHPHHRCHRDIVIDLGRRRRLHQLSPSAVYGRPVQASSTGVSPTRSHRRGSLFVSRVQRSCMAVENLKSAVLVSALADSGSSDTVLRPLVLLRLRERCGRLGFFVFVFLRLRFGVRRALLHQAPKRSATGIYIIQE